MTATVTADGVKAQVFFIAWAACFSGPGQINIQSPDNLPEAATRSPVAGFGDAEQMAGSRILVRLAVHLGVARFRSGRRPAQQRGPAYERIAEGSQRVEGRVVQGLRSHFTKKGVTS